MMQRNCYSTPSKAVFSNSVTNTHTQESTTSLIALYQAWNKPEEAEQWRAKLPQVENIRK